MCRCDQFPNCADFSDEAACQLVVLPDNYVSDYAPFTVDTDTGRMRRIGVKIKVAVTIMLHFRTSETTFLADGSHFYPGHQRSRAEAKDSV